MNTEVIIPGAVVQLSSSGRVDYGRHFLVVYIEGDHVWAYPLFRSTKQRVQRRYNLSNVSLTAKNLVTFLVMETNWRIVGTVCLDSQQRPAVVVKELGGGELEGIAFDGLPWRALYPRVIASSIYEYVKIQQAWQEPE